MTNPRLATRVYTTDISGNAYGLPKYIGGRFPILLGCRLPALGMQRQILGFFCALLTKQDVSERSVTQPVRYLQAGKS